MNIGLDVLNDHKSFSMEEFLMEFYEGYIALEAEGHQLNVLCDTYASLEAISGCIRKHGVTQSLETLYGENFRSAASMEEENEAAKQSILRRIWETIKRWIAKFVAWVKSLFSRKTRVIERLKDISEHADSYALPITVYNNDTIKNMQIFGSISDALGSLVDNPTDDTISGFSKALEDAKEAADVGFKKATDDNHKINITNAAALREYAGTLAFAIEDNGKMTRDITNGVIDAFNINAIKKGWLKMKAAIMTRAHIRACLVHAQLLFSQLKKK